MTTGFVVRTTGAVLASLQKACLAAPGDTFGLLLGNAVMHTENIVVDGAEEATSRSHTSLGSSSEQKKKKNTQHTSNPPPLPSIELPSLVMTDLMVAVCCRPDGVPSAC